MHVQTFDTNTQEGRDGVISLLDRLSAGSSPVLPLFYPIETVEQALDRVDREWAAARAMRGVK